MSMTTCHDCGAYIDTDDDPGCYVEIGNMKRLHKEVPICEPCREERQEAADHAAGREFYEEATWFNRVGALS